MVTYIIASKAKNPYLAEALGEYLQKNCNDVFVKTVIKHKKEWAEFLDSVCRTYGFKKRSCPLVYTIEGTLIGDAQQFVEHVKDKYSKAIAITKDTQKKRTQQNVSMINEYMRKKKDGLTLGEKIEQHLREIKTSGLVDLMEAFFKQETDRGTHFQVRRLDLMQDKRQHDVIDEIERAIRSQKEKEQKEASRDMDYEEFLAKYIDHIEGRVDADQRFGNRPVTADDQNPESQPNLANAKGSGALQNTSTNQFEENKNEESKIENASEKLNDSSISKSKVKEDQLNKSKDSILSKDDYKYEIPQLCHITLMKGNQIEKLHRKYILMSHPFPKIEGEMIMFLPVKQDQFDPQLVIFRDYSLRKRLPTKPKPKKLSSYQQKKLETEDKESSKLSCLEIDLRQPLSSIDWKNFAQVLNEVQGLGFVSILPVGEKSSQPVQNQLIHILPNSKIPFQSLPLDLLITSKVQYVKLQQEQALEEARHNGGQVKSPQKHSKDKDSKKNEILNIITVDEYRFPHAVYIFETSSLKEDHLINGYNKIHQFLQLDDHPESGLTIIATPNWMFVTTITGPYTKHTIYAPDQRVVPVYADPYAYCGILNIQNTQKEWPATAGLSDDTLSPYEVLERSSQYGRPEHEEILTQFNSQMSQKKQSFVKRDENIDLERKKASQILHYLMERKQESEFRDPFDLLRNMQDVIQIYEPLKSNDIIQDQRSLTVDETTSSKINSARQNIKSKVNTQYHFYPQNQQENMSASKLRKTMLRKHYLNQSQDNNQFNQQTEYSQLPEANVQLPSIMKKQRTFDQKKLIHPQSGKRSTKTFLSKHEEKVLDLSNVADAIMAAQDPNNLELKYQKIKKIKEEFNDIKTQFGIPTPQYFNPSQTSQLSYMGSRRNELRSRGQNSTTAASSIPAQSQQRTEKRDSFQEQPKNFIIRNRVMTSQNVFRPARLQNTQLPPKDKTIMTSPHSRSELRITKFAYGSAKKEPQSTKYNLNQAVETEITFNNHKQDSSRQALDKEKLQNEIGQGGIKQQNQSLKEIDRNIRIKRRKLSISQNQNKDYNYKIDGSLCISHEGKLSNLNKISGIFGPINNSHGKSKGANENKIGSATSGYSGLKQYQIQKVNSEALEKFSRLQTKESIYKPVYIQNKSKNRSPQKIFDYSANSQISQQVEARSRTKNMACDLEIQKMDLPYSKRNDQLDVQLISSRSFQQPKSQFETEGQKFSTIGPSIEADKQTRNLEAIQEEETNLLRLNINHQAKVHQTQFDFHKTQIKNEQKNDVKNKTSGGPLFEQYKQNQQQQIQLLSKKKKKDQKKQGKKQVKLTFESVYMREAILALIHSQSNQVNPLKVKQYAALGKKRKSTNSSQIRTKSSVLRRQKDINTTVIEGQQNSLLNDETFPDLYIQQYGGQQINSGELIINDQRILSHNQLLENRDSYEFQNTENSVILLNEPTEENLFNIPDFCEQINDL
ncbi:UNKNOWN [Stylonychia lemnae]|uniref:Uncharacterized protein n=1 Tax=Stylonychia lemnae TaxID=5949 RepID=A0A078B3L9_STYLE|nr:UNKNOWN [Stylonychia lemnae]|eukprot:CDW89049.1 UNKNOWN [Stylonychia lemnae]